MKLVPEIGIVGIIFKLLLDPFLHGLVLFDLFLLLSLDSLEYIKDKIRMSSQMILQESSWLTSEKFAHD